MKRGRPKKLGVASTIVLVTASVDFHAYASLSDLSSMIQREKITRFIGFTGGR